MWENSFSDTNAPTPSRPKNKEMSLHTYTTIIKGVLGLEGGVGRL